MSVHAIMPPLPARRPRRPIPGFGLSLGYSIVYLSFVVLLPLIALAMSAARLDFDGWMRVLTDDRVIAALRLSFGSALAAAIVNSVFGPICAYALVRFRFPGRRMLDALVDVPFALPTAVAGIALALEATSPGTAVHVCEPAGFDDHARSLEADARLANAPGAQSICDALLAATPGEITFSINRRLLHSGIAVTDDEVLRAMGVAFRDLKLVVEPGGAVALAAALSGKLPVAGRTVVVVCSGGNVDPLTFGRALATL